MCFFLFAFVTFLLPSPNRTPSKCNLYQNEKLWISPNYNESLGKTEERIFKYDFFFLFLIFFKFFKTLFSNILFVNHLGGPTKFCFFLLSIPQTNNRRNPLKE